MVFSSIPFIFFFLVLTSILYYLVPFDFKGFKVKNFVLMIFSLIFYAWGEPIYITLMIFSSIVDYTNGQMIKKYHDNIKMKRLFMIFSVIINLGLLGFFKYSDFLIVNINNLFGLSIETLNLGLPIGISFFTFQTMSYSIDVYRGDVKPEDDFLTFMTYVCMFPQLIAGPIVRYETVAEELSEREINFEHFASGLVRFTIGVFKKVLVANQVGRLWSTVSLLPGSELSTVMSWLGILAYSLQIYFDFSGYSDMAIGMGKMLGFNYLENFNYPYISKSITEFWRRWHMSLSTFFRDYVYIPLGGSRCSTLLNIRNIAVVWALTGLWHGADWNFIFWGVYFGTLLIIEKFVLNNWLKKQHAIIQHAYALILIAIGWMIFSSCDIAYPKEYIMSLVGVGTSLVNDKTLFYLSEYGTVLIIGMIFSMPVYPFLREKYNNISNKTLANLITILVTIVFIVLLIITVSYLVSDTYNPFLYFRF